MPFRFADGVLVETTEPDIRQVRRPQQTYPHPASTADDEPGTDPWPFGAVVAFRRRRGTTGYGQVERTTPTGLITIRTWLPCPTRQVTLTDADVHLVGTLDELDQLMRNW